MSNRLTTSPTGPIFASKVPGCGLTCPPWLAPWLGLFECGCSLEADWSEGAACTWLPWWNRFPTTMKESKNQNKKTCNKMLGKESHHFNHFTEIHFFYHLLSSCHFQTLLADPEAPTMLSTMLSRFRICIHSPYGRCRHLIVDFGHGWDIPKPKPKRSGKK